MITWVFVPLDLILPDQPNRVVRTRMLRGVGGGSCEAPPYPDRRAYAVCAIISWYENSLSPALAFACSIVIFTKLPF